MVLSAEQHDRLEHLPEAYRVIGTYRDKPVISYPGGRMIVLEPSGRISAVTMRLRIELAERRMERAL
jgi:hypothetical protein